MIKTRGHDHLQTRWFPIFLLAAILVGATMFLHGQATGGQEVPVSDNEGKLPDQTDALGKNAFSIEPDKQEPKARKMGPAGSRPEAATATDAEAKNKSILLPRACLVTGRIIQGQAGRPQEAPRAAPLRDVLITLKDSLGNVLCETTNSLGIYLISAPPGSYLLTAEKKGYQASKPQKVTVRSRNVLLPNVALHSEGAQASRNEKDVPDQTVARGEEASSIESDDRSPKADHVVQVSSPQIAAARAEKKLLSAPRASLVSGRVSDGRAERSAQVLGPVPLSGVHITLEDSQGNVICETTNSLGVYLISAPLGHYLMTAEKEGYHPAKPQKVTVRSGSMFLPEMVLHPEDAPASLWGTVTWGPDPLPMMTVAIRSLTQGFTDTIWTEDDGSYLFEELPVPDSYVLEVFEEEFETLRSDPIWLASPGKQWDFHYPMGHICWQITQDGKTPLPGMRIRLRGDGVDSTLITDDMGVCETAACLRAGEFLVTIAADQEDVPAASYRLHLSPDESRLETITLPTQHMPSSTDCLLERAQITLQQDRLHTGQPCSLRVRAYAATGVDLSPWLREENVAWAVLQGPGQIERSAEDPTRATYVTQKAGQARIEAVVFLNGITASARTLLACQDGVLGQLEIAGPALPMISNRSQATFRCVALDTTGQQMSIRPRWDFQPDEAGALSPSRSDDQVLFVPDGDFIGQVRIFLTDSTSGQTAEYNAWYGIPDCDRGLSVYHLLAGGDPGVVLRDEGDFRLHIPNSAIPPGDSTQLLLRKPFAPDVKRCTPRHEVHGQVYELRSSDSAHFLQPLEMVLPIVPQARSLATTVGRWDPQALEWVELGGTRGDEQISIEVDHFSQFAVLTTSNPLAMKDIQLSPNPFTPHDPYGLQLGFTLSTDRSRAPFVTIRVYSMMGDLVRTICQNEPVPKGRYVPGEIFVDSHGRDITRWDGRTDDGEMARNGRYLIHFQAEDSGGMVEALKPVVLVK